MCSSTEAGISFLTSKTALLYAQVQAARFTDQLGPAVFEGFNSALSIEKSLSTARQYRIGLDRSS
jgi:hypothetical protein